MLHRQLPILGDAVASLMFYTALRFGQRASLCVDWLLDNQSGGTGLGVGINEDEREFARVADGYGQRSWD
jgi:hypothetical protein